MAIDVGSPQTETQKTASPLRIRIASGAEPARDDAVHTVARPPEPRPSADAAARRDSLDDVDPRTTPVVLGVDIGSTTVKAVVVDPETLEILWADYQRHQTKQPEKVLEFLVRIG